MSDEEKDDVLDPNAVDEMAEEIDDEDEETVGEEAEEGNE